MSPGHAGAAVVERLLCLADETVCTDRRANVAAENLWCISATASECAATDPAALGRALERVARAWSEQIRARGVGDDLVFYAWVDDVAGQLRCSAVFGTAERLPFQCPTRLVDSPDTIARSFLAAPATEAMPLDDLGRTHDGAPALDREGYVLDVWAVAL